MTWSIFLPPGSSERFIYFGNPMKKGCYIHQPLIGGVSELLGGFFVKRSDFDSHEILIPEKGTLSVLLNGVERSAEPGDFIFLPMSVNHVYSCKKKVRLLWFHIHPELLESQFLPQPLIRKIHYGEEIRLLSELILREESVYAESSAYTGKALWDYLTKELAVRGVEHRYAPRIEKMLEDLRRSLNHPWTVQEMARLAGMSESNLYAVTRKIYKIPPLQLLRRIRMEMASSLLLRNDLDLKMIAEQVGYSDSFAFSKAFSKWYRCSPKFFRKRKENS